MKLGGVGLAGLFVPQMSFNPFPYEIDPNQQGRVTTNILWLYDKPSFEANRTKMYWRDLTLNITNLTVSEDENAYNRVWYEIGAEGYAYSGNIQPVRTILNQPVLTIPSTGALAEVTVPYTDAHEEANVYSKVAYRLYYETLHWIYGRVVSENDGTMWYRILDDKWKEYYYAPAEHFRFVPDEELAPISADVPDKYKRIEVRLDQQLIVAYEYDNPVFAARVASGGIFRSGTYSTPQGSFMTYHKRPTRHMAAGDVTANGFDLPGVPWVLYIMETGLSIHGTYWHNDYGHPRSHGCINLTPAAAKWLFLWTSPSVKPGEAFAYKSEGTKVQITL